MLTYDFQNAPLPKEVLKLLHLLQSILGYYALAGGSELAVALSLPNQQNSQNKRSHTDLDFFVGATSHSMKEFYGARIVVTVWNIQKYLHHSSTLRNIVFDGTLMAALTSFWVKAFQYHFPQFWTVQKHGQALLVAVQNEERRNGANDQLLHKRFARNGKIQYYIRGYLRKHDSKYEGMQAHQDRCLDIGNEISFATQEKDLGKLSRILKRFIKCTRGGDGRQLECIALQTSAISSQIL